MDEKPRRKINRVKDYDYSQPGAYFVTICTANREKILWEPVGADIIRLDRLPLSAEGEIVRQGISQIDTHYNNVSVDKYCIMPDHVHILISMTSGDRRMISAPTLSTVVGSMKRWTSRQIARPIWQKSFYEHIIRNQRDYDEIWNYIENNPLKYIARK